MTEQKQETPSGRIISVRKLVALDIVFHGSRLILAEFAFTIALGAALGFWIIASMVTADHAASPLKLIVGAYFLCVAINYVPMLCYAIAVTRHHSAREEVAAELAAKGKSAVRYGTQALLLFVPLVIPLLALAQERRSNHAYAQ